MKVTKEVTFDSAHMLSNYKGKCGNLHGHTYRLQVTVDQPLQTEGNEECMVMDFNTLKKAVDFVTEAFDHAIIFSDAGYRSEAENALIDWADKYGMNYTIISAGKSTSECIAAEIKARIACALPIVEMGCITVRIWETPISFAEA